MCAITYVLYCLGPAPVSPFVLLLLIFADSRYISCLSSDLINGLDDELGSKLGPFLTLGPGDMPPPYDSLTHPFWTLLMSLNIEVRTKPYHIST